MLEHKSNGLWVKIGGELPPLDEASAFVRRDHCGAVNLFEGVTRNHDKGKSVTSLFYEAYEEMALEQTLEILNEAKSRFPIGAAALLHKTGEVPVGSASMIVAVSTPHRKESAEAVLHIIKRLKEDVPIWKKEYFNGDNAENAEWK